MPSAELTDLGWVKEGGAVEILPPYPYLGPTRPAFIVQMGKVCQAHHRPREYKDGSPSTCVNQAADNLADVRDM